MASWEDALTQAIQAVPDPDDDALTRAIEEAATPPSEVSTRPYAPVRAWERFKAGTQQAAGAILPAPGQPGGPGGEYRSLGRRGLSLLGGLGEMALPSVTAGEILRPAGEFIGRHTALSPEELQRNLDEARAARERLAGDPLAVQNLDYYIASLERGLGTSVEEQAKAAGGAMSLGVEMLSGLGSGTQAISALGRRFMGRPARQAAQAVTETRAAAGPRPYQEPAQVIEPPVQGPQRPVDWIEPAAAPTPGPVQRPTILDEAARPLEPTLPTAAEVAGTRAPAPQPLLIADEFGRPIPQNYLVQQLERVIDEVPEVIEEPARELRRAGEVAEEVTGGRIAARPEPEVTEADFWRLAGQEGVSAEQDIQRMLRESIEPAGPGAARISGELPEGAIRPGEEPFLTVPRETEEPYRLPMPGAQPGGQRRPRAIAGGAEDVGWVKPDGTAVSHADMPFPTTHREAIRQLHNLPDIETALNSGWVRYVRSGGHINIEAGANPQSINNAIDYIGRGGRGVQGIVVELTGPEGRMIGSEIFDRPGQAIEWFKNKLKEQTGAFFPSREAAEKAPKTLRQLRGRQAEGPAPVPVEPTQPLKTARETAAARTEEIVSRPVDVGAVPSREAGRVLRRGLPEQERLVTEGVGETEGIVPGFNLDTINTTDDVKRIISGSAEGQRTLIEKARGPAVTDEYLRTIAAESGLSPADLMKRNKENPFNKVEVVRYKSVIEASATNVRNKLNELQAGGTSRDALREALGQHAMIAGAFARGRAETGRALRAFQTIPDDLLDDIIPMLRELDPKNVAVLTKVVRKAVDPTWWDRFMFVITNARLTNPVTHGVNIGSNTSMLVAAPTRKLLAGRPHEAMYDAIGIWHMLRSGAIESAGNAFSTRIPMAGMERYAERLKGLGAKFETTRQLEGSRLHPFTSEGGQAFQKYAEMPGRALAAEDEFFRSVIASGELHSMGLREAKKRGVIGKKETDDFVARFVSSEATDEALLKAWNASKYNTFNQRLGSFGQKMLSLRKSKVAGTDMAPLEFFFNFVTTPTNVGKVAIEHSPLGFLKAVRAHKLYKEGRLGEELSKPMLGTAGLMLATAFTWAVDGRITGRGPSDPAKRKVWLENHQPYSFEWEIGGKRHALSYERFAPMATVLGASSDIYYGYNDVVGGVQKSDREIGDYAKLIGSAIGHIAQNILNQTYWQQLTTASKAITDPERWGEHLARSLTGELQPVAAISAIARAADPYEREVSPLEQPISEIPFASRTLRPQRTTFGEPKERAGGTGALGFVNRLLNPARYKEVGTESLMRELEREGIGVGRASRDLPSGARMNKEQFSKFEDLAGGIFKQKLTDIVDSMDWQDAETEEERKPLVGTALQQARQEARQQLVDDGVLPEDALEPRALRR